jgi:hypothetical protein
MVSPSERSNEHFGPALLLSEAEMLPQQSPERPTAISSALPGVALPVQPEIEVNSRCFVSVRSVCTAGSVSRSPQAQHRSEYRSLAVMRNA